MHLCVVVVDVVCVGLGGGGVVGGGCGWVDVCVLVWGILQPSSMVINQ